MSPMNATTKNKPESNYRNTIDANARIFAEMNRKLSTDHKNLLGVLNNLEAWLRVDKAYYAEARPIIVTLVETAMNALSHTLSLDDGARVYISQCPPEAQNQISAYAQLLLTIKQYDFYFRDDISLQERLNNVLRTVSFNDEGQPETFQSRPPIFFLRVTSASRDISSGLVESINANTNPTNPPQVVSASIGQEVSNQIGMSSSPRATTQPSDATKSTSMDRTNLSSLPATSSRFSTASSQNTLSRMENSGSPKISQANTNMAPKSRLLSLAKLDKDSWKKSKTSKTPELGRSTAQEIHPKSLGTEARSSPSYSTPPGVSQNKVVGKGSIVSPPVEMISTSTNETDNNNPEVVLTPQTSASASPQVPSSTQMQSPLQGLCSIPPSSVANDDAALKVGSSTVVTVKLSQNSLEHTSTLTDLGTHVGVESGDKQTMMAKSNLPKPRLAFSFSAQDKASLQDSSKEFLMLSNNEPRPEVVDELATRFVNLMQDFLSLNYETAKSFFDPGTVSPSRSSAQAKSSSSKRARSPTADDRRVPSVRRKLDLKGASDQEDEHHRFSTSSSPQKNKTLSHHPDPPFETICVFTFPGGPSSHDVTFDINDEQLSLAQRWVNRYTDFEETLPCLSFTLACIAMPYLTSHSGDRCGADIFRDLTIEWPQDGGFSLKVQADGDVPIVLPMAPPLYIRNGELVDLTSFIGLKTTITFTSDRDYSKYTFALRVHRPTESQLHQFYQTSSLASSKSDIWRDLRPINQSLSPVRSLLDDLSL